MGFFVNRSDLKADRNKKLIDWIAGITLISTVVYVVISLRLEPGVNTLIRCAQGPLLRTVFFPSTAATWMVSGAYSGKLIWVVLGAVSLLSLGSFGVWLALTQLPYMYDQAAVKGFGSAELRTMRRNNDMYGLRAQQAREGKGKVDRLSRFLGELRFSGASALIWREVILQLRGARFIYVFLGPLQVIITVAPVLALPISTDLDGIGSMVILMQLLGVVMLTMNSAVSGFMELLKRVDFQKPLPFRPAGTVFWEVASKCLPNILFTLISAAILLIVRPMLWSFVLASIWMVLGMSLLVSATVFLVTIGFPDAGDASQRGFRGILTLLGMVIFGLPGAATFSALHYLLHLDPMLASLPACGVCIGITMVVSYFAGLLYESYNPSE